MTPLTNGNCVIASRVWSDVQALRRGAVTWADGSAGLVGEVNESNSLMGSSLDHQVGESVRALSNGPYVVLSPRWYDIDSTIKGALTWSNGFQSTSGIVSAANSLVNFTNAASTIALDDGSYLIADSNWGHGPGQPTAIGALLWGSGHKPLAGVFAGYGALLGSIQNDHVGSEVFPLVRGNYVARHNDWNDTTGATSVGHANGSWRGTVTPLNSVIGVDFFAGTMRFAYDVERDQLIVVEPWMNRVVLFKPDALFATGLD